MVAVSHPFDLVKVRMQTAGAVLVDAGAAAATAAASSARTPTSSYQALKHIIAADGLLGLYRGVTPVIIGTPPVLATNFWAYYVSQQAVMSLTGGGQRRHADGSRYDPATTHNTVDRLSLHQIGLAGALAAVPVSFLLGPAEQIKIRLQVQETSMKSHHVSGRHDQGSKGFVQVVRQIVREGGVRAVFRGTGATILRDTPGSYFYFLTYEGIKRWFKKSDETHVHPAAVMLAGGIAGMVNWTIAIPVDTIKSRLQSAPPAEASVRKVVSKLFAESGPAGLFRGLGPTLLRAFPASAAFFFGIEMSTRVMDKFL
ncbi:mitochondrial carrier domain-containing protein [Entophlyctis helioformis]|nr:mitochondrial carrier domain-containing protein [Entophlyctis helioformis]